MPRELAPPLPSARLWVLAMAGLWAPVLAWSALVLPWRVQAPLGLLLWALALLHLSAAASALWRPERLAWALGLLGAASLGAALVLGGCIGATALEMLDTFGQIGAGVAVALLAIGWLALLATLPVAAVGLHYWRRHHWRRRRGQ
jgi:hypothetical protein